MEVLHGILRLSSHQDALLEVVESFQTLISPVVSRISLDEAPGKFLDALVVSLLPLFVQLLLEQSVSGIRYSAHA